MKKSPKSPRIFMLGAACTALVVALVAAIYVAMPSIRARRAVTKTESLQIGRSTFSEAKQVAEQMEAKPSGACSPAECEWILGIGNIAVPELWRGQGEVFEASFHVKDGLVDQKDFGYWIGFGSIVSGVTVSEKMDWSGRPIETRSDTNFASEGDRSVIHLWLTPRDSTDTRKRYTSFNWNCFWQFHGCEDAHELMPTGDW